jgi:putative flippase GtrA
MRGELVRFLLVGALNTALSFGAYVATTAGGLPPAPAAATVFAAGAANGYVLNGRWTFRVRTPPRALPRYAAQLADAAATSATM